MKNVLIEVNVATLERPFDVIQLLNALFSVPSVLRGYLSGPAVIIRRWAENVRKP